MHTDPAPNFGSAFLMIKACTYKQPTKLKRMFFVNGMEKKTLSYFITFFNRICQTSFIHANLYMQRIFHCEVSVATEKLRKLRLGL